MKRNGIPEKPKTQKEQISVLWDIFCNHIFSKVMTLDMQMKFVLVFLGLILAFLAVLTHLMVSLC
jgi:hypothetical protein